MKAERKGVKVFFPVVITLETQEEEDMMFAILNCEEGKPLTEYEFTLPPFSIKSYMWKQFNEIYRRQYV